MMTAGPLDDVAGSGEREVDELGGEPHLRHGSIALKWAALRKCAVFVTAHEKLKVLGTRHCFNNIADSKDNLLSLRNGKPGFNQCMTSPRLMKRRGR